MPTPKVSAQLAQEAAAAFAKHGSQAAAARALGLPRNTFVNRLRAANVDHAPRPAEMPLPPPRSSAAARKTVADFRKLHDKDFIIPDRIRARLSEMADDWEYEAEFSRLAQVSLADLSIYREQFEGHIVVLRRDNKRVWAKTPKIAEQLRAMVR